MSFLPSGPISGLSFPVLPCLLFFLARSALVSSTCYFPDGAPSDDVPCSSDSSVDFCCGKYSICLANKVCLNNIGTFARGSCTDKSWNATSCPFFCLSDSLMIACPPLSSGTWCCGGSSCCNDAANHLTLGQATILSSPSSASTASAFLSASTTVDPKASTSNPASSAFASLGSRSTGIISATTAPTSIPASSSGPPDSAKVGIGIGVPLGAIIIALAVYLFYLDRQLRTKTRSYGAEGKAHVQGRITNGFPQQSYAVELENHQDPPELAAESRFH